MRTERLRELKCLIPGPSTLNVLWRWPRALTTAQNLVWCHHSLCMHLLGVLGKPLWTICFWPKKFLFLGWESSCLTSDAELRRKPSPKEQWAYLVGQRFHSQLRPRESLGSSLPSVLQNCNVKQSWHYRNNNWHNICEEQNMVISWGTKKA